MELEEVLLLIHILAVMTWLGGGFLVGVFAGRMKTADPQHRLGFARAMRFISTGVFLPAAGIVLAMGVWMVADSSVYDFEQAWVIIGIGVVAVTAAMVPLLFKPTINQGIAAMEAGGGPAVGAIMRRLSVGARIALLLEFIALWAMVVKPGL